MPYKGGLYSGLASSPCLVNDPTEVQTLDDLIDDIVGANMEQSVVAITMMPTAFYSSNEYPAVQTMSVDKPTLVGNYQPRNNKLLTYPYCFLTVDTLNDSKNYRYEWFKTQDDKADFVLTCGFSPSPEIIATPYGYNNGAIGSDMNSTESVTCSGFPQCAFTVDAYRAWLAQKALPEAVGAVGTALMASASPIGAIGASIGISQTYINSIIESTQGSKARGSQGTSTEVAMRAKDIYFKNMSITNDYAQVIDSFFDRFGYACERIKIPNRNARPHWTYTKTRDVGIKGTVPADAMRKLKEIYNNGITFWVNGSEVGDYSLDNRTIHGGDNTNEQTP